MGAPEFTPANAAPLQKGEIETSGYSMDKKEALKGKQRKQTDFDCEEVRKLKLNRGHLSPHRLHRTLKNYMTLIIPMTEAFNIGVWSVTSERKFYTDPFSQLTHLWIHLRAKCVFQMPTG